MFASFGSFGSRSRLGGWRVAAVPKDDRDVSTTMSENPRDLVSRVKQAMLKFGYKQTDVMRDSGVSNTVLCHWLKRKYKGDNARVNARLTEWVQGVEERALWKSTHTPSRGFAGTPLFMDVDLVTLKSMATDKLIPIKIDVELDGRRLQDAFLWNLSEKRITPEWFAGALCEDDHLPSSFIPLIVQSIHQQLAAAKESDGDKSSSVRSTSDPVLGTTSKQGSDMLTQDDDEASVSFEEESPNPLDAEDAKTRLGSSSAPSLRMDTTSQLSQVASRTASDMEGLSESGGQMASSSSTAAQDRNNELQKETLIVVKLDLTLRGLHLQDQFVWDVDNTLNSPEEFAHDMCCDLGLGGDWLALIAYSIRSQARLFRQFNASQSSSVTDLGANNGDSSRTVPELIHGPQSSSQVVRDISQVDKWRPRISLVVPS